MRGRMRGNVHSVKDEYLGSKLNADANSGDTELHVYSLASFDENGGQVVLLGHSQKDLVTYTGYNDDPDDPQLIGIPDSGDGSIGSDWRQEVTEVRVVPMTLTRYAEVQGAREEDTAKARVPVYLHALMPVGTRDTYDTQTEVVEMEWVEYQWVVSDILGSAPKIQQDHAPVERVLHYVAEGINAGDEGEFLLDLKGTLALAVCKVGGNPGGGGSGAAVFYLNLNGTTIGTFTIPIGHQVSNRVDLSAYTIARTDHLSVKQHAVFNATPNLEVFVGIILDQGVGT